MRYLFTCGGTAGHIYPAVGVAEAIKELDADAQFLFVGAKGMMETELVPREGYDIETVTITNIHRSLKMKELAHNAKTLRNVIVATAEAKKIIERFRPDAAIGTGGYVCYPVLKAAHSMHIPTFVHESNAVPGLTTKMLARTVDCIMVGFEGARENYKPGTRVVFTGTPVRAGFRQGSQAQAKRALGLDDGKKLVLSVWGSLGSEFMNGVMTDFIANAVRFEELRLIHSAGRARYERMASALEKKCPDYAACGMDVRPYIFDIPQVMAAADLIICRSGASTLAELTAMGKPAILIPSPNVTGNHQEKNARVLEKCGAARVMLEGEFTPESLYEDVRTLLFDDARLKSMSGAMAEAGLSDAAGRIAQIVLDGIKR